MERMPSVSVFHLPLRIVRCPSSVWGEFLIGNHNHLTAPLCRLKWTALRDLLDCQIDEAVLRELMTR